MTTDTQAGIVRRFMDLSTSHLTEETASALFGDELQILAWLENAEGASCIVYVPSDPDMMEAVPADLMACIRFARAHGCDRLSFDRDGPTIDAPPIYDEDETS